MGDALRDIEDFSKVFGSAKKVVIGKDNTTIMEGNGNK